MNMKVGNYFNPDQHLTFHQDKQGNMIGGGYQVNNLLYQNKTPLFVAFGDNHDGQYLTGGGGGGGSRPHTGDESENRHFIPEKFSDLFRDLAVPAGLFVMPPQFKPRNYAFEVPDQPDTETSAKPKSDGDDADTDSDTDTDTDTDSDDEGRTKTVPNDIFDKLLSLVTPTERIQHDVKTRRRREMLHHENKKERKRQNKTRRK